VNLLERLFPARLQATPPPTNEERRKWLANVGDNDPCLKAHLDILQETLEREFYAATSFNSPDVERLRACDGMRVAFLALRQMESERAQAKAWRAEQETPQG
jgi:hypothetical protein